MDEVVQRANQIADRLANVINQSNNIPDHTRVQLEQLYSELTRTSTLYSLVHHDEVCQIEAASTTLLELAPKELAPCRASFTAIDAILLAFEQDQTSSTTPKYARILSHTHKQLKALHGDVRADLVLAIRHTLNQDLFRSNPCAIQLRNFATARDPSFEHDIWQIRIQRGDAPLKPSLLLANPVPPQTWTLQRRICDSTTMGPSSRPVRYLWMTPKTLKLATFLHAGASAYVLHCVGFRVDQPRRRMEYLYDASPLQGYHRGLHRLSDHLGTPAGHFTRGRREAAARLSSDRIRFAGSLARSLSELHAADRVHGDVRAENVWFAVRGGEYEARVSLPLLVGFGLEAGELWRRTGDDGSGEAALEEAKRRDILAMGVVLMEIGLGGAVAEARGPAGGGDAIAAAEHLRTLNGVMGGRYTASVRAALDPRRLPGAFASLKGVVGDGEEVCGLDRAFRVVVVDELLGVIERG
ncbi:uncharacterized protein ColSpa_06115 [Colletotrichum spaethianum]|uniref:Protein kinase domain-containing protein n=1 Tax=Colletotrichum spaethianum TaxID=700344 RepID=A0AA37P7V8_9PEZI|nr:uncharacterized protein ColSpa_06115 [Colletotrichum spaethianum]GKT45934.1 hypothetical protein ColSpa_06115 [Colletotrichum spaethianum]